MYCNMPCIPCDVRVGLARLSANIPITCAWINESYGHFIFGKMQDDEEGEEDEVVSKKKQNDVIEKLFQDEHQRRMNLLGNQGQERKVIP